ncbi:hypothetical protein [Blastopirellula marina]|uniref:Uncharacterized protein n=1 Tax=Blastopirellula marina TaxID=124 RepID=A0A2S8GP06_9BACT|nr:hypothetical protein [Blastopirellula marina]PQO46160.1 hypothetical protein C5Y93_09220 [Blastopirellula marina]
MFPAEALAPNARDAEPSPPPPSEEEDAPAVPQETAAELEEDEELVEAEVVDPYDIPGVRPADLYHFVRQARLVLSNEMGWNERSLARLNFLADQFLIPHTVRSDLFRQLDDRNFEPPVPKSEADNPPAGVLEGEDSPSGDAAPTLAEEEEQEERRRKAERKKRQSPSRLYVHYLKKAFEALPAKRINQRREQKLVLEGTTKLGLSEVLARDLLRETAQNQGYVLASEEQKPEDREKESAREQLLVDFQQRAATIIAGQGGVNSLTRIMIAQVATDLGLSDEERDAALASIQKQSEKNEVDARLQQRASSFREFVRGKLDAINHGIVIASLAQKLVQIGVDMHGIDEELAWLTLRELLQEEDLRLVTVDQARSHIGGLVGDIMREEGFLSIQNRQRLMSEGAQWGLSPGKCQQLIDDKVDTFNHSKSRVQQRVTLSLTALFALVIGGGALLMYLDTPPPRGVPEGGPAAAARSGRSSDPTSDGQISLNVGLLNDEPDEPAWQRQSWWSEKLSLALLDVYQTDTSLQDSLTEICSSDEDRRIRAYRSLVPKLIATSVAHPGEKLQQSIRASLIGLVRDEPSDKAVGVLAAELTSDVSLKDSSIDAIPTSQLLEKAYVSVSAADQTDLPETRRDLFLDKLRQQLGITYSAAVPPLELTMNEVIRDQYRKLSELAASDPNLAAQLHATVSNTARNYLPPEQIVAKDSTLIAVILPEMTDNWEAYRPIIQQLIDSPTPERMLPLLDVFSQSVRDAGIQQELAAMLARRIGRGLDADEPAQSADLVRSELGLNAMVAGEGEMQRMFSQRAAAVSWDVADDIQPDALAGEVSQIGYLSVLGHAASTGELGKRVFEETIEAGPPKAAEKEESAPVRSTSALAALSKCENLIGRLPRAKDPSSRLDNFKVLCTLAGDVEDVDYETANILAEYILVPKPRAEQSRLRSGLRAFQHWTNFKLAMADQMPRARRAADDLQDIVSGVLGETISISSVQAAREELRNELLRHSLESLGGQGHVSDTLSASAANATAELLTDYYLRHARLEGISTEQLAGAELPDAIADRLIALERSRIEGMALSDLESANLQEITRHEIALDYLSNSPIANMAARQRTWLRLLALRHGKEHPQLKSQLAQIVSRLETQDAAATNVFEQLRSGELALVKLWQLTGGAA